jgi:hypothetical protein
MLFMNQNCGKRPLPRHDSGSEKALDAARW